jgi:hypothetical protein
MGLLRFFKSKSTQCLSDMVNNDSSSGKILFFFSIKVRLRSETRYPIVQTTQIMLYLTGSFLFGLTAWVPYRQMKCVIRISHPIDCKALL